MADNGGLLDDLEALFGAAASDSLYAVLGVTASATGSELKKAYFAKARL